ncbi:MAG: hypothetical protein WCJ66_10420 [Verrucomicrobiota bacterium]
MDTSNVIAEFTVAMVAARAYLAWFEAQPCESLSDSHPHTRPGSGLASRV